MNRYRKQQFLLSSISLLIPAFLRLVIPGLNDVGIVGGLIDYFELDIDLEIPEWGDAGRLAPLMLLVWDAMLFYLILLPVLLWRRSQRKDKDDGVF